jgi:hypothetical protein
MASSPMRKLRKSGAIDENGNLVTIPRLPSVAGANKPPGWRQWGAAEMGQHLLNLSLNRHAPLAILVRQRRLNTDPVLVDVTGCRACG